LLLANQDEELISLKVFDLQLLPTEKFHHKHIDHITFSLMALRQFQEKIRSEAVYSPYFLIKRRVAV